MRKGFAEDVLTRSPTVYDGNIHKLLPTEILIPLPEAVAYFYSANQACRTQQCTYKKQACTQNSLASKVAMHLTSGQQYSGCPRCGKHNEAPGLIRVQADMRPLGKFVLHAVQPHMPTNAYYMKYSHTSRQTHAECRTATDTDISDSLKVVI